MKKLPLFLALDVETKNEALFLVQETTDCIQAYKVGPRLFLSYGPELISEIKSHNSPQIFLDFKFYDIPSSTLKAVQSAFKLGVDFVTVHAGVGKEALSLLSRFEKETIQERFFQILFVTVLSSVKASQKNQSRILELADQVYQAGLKGLVCSPKEVKVLRQKYKDMFLVTPGIRLEGDNKDDQERVMTPKQALNAGSSALVMGRSLIRGKDVKKALKDIYDSLEN